MANYAMIEKGSVVNIIVWDGVTPYNPGSQFTLVAVPDEAFVDMGYLWDETNGFNAPQLGINTEE